MLQEQEFRDLMASVCAPVTVVTGYQDGLPRGATVSSVASLSLRPPMITLALDERSSLLRCLLRTKRFGVNVLAHTQDKLATIFAAHDADRFGEADWLLYNGLPRLTGAASWMECEVTRAVSGGDHRLILGTITDADVTPRATLIHFRRQFGTHSSLAVLPLSSPRTPINEGTNS